MERTSNDAKILLDKAESTDTTLFVKFELLTSKYGRENIYCFVEGYDMQYYISRIREIGGVEPYAIECKGKKNVIAAHNLISNKKEYNKYKKAYFVDRDFDDNSTLSEDIYVTPCYSIENLYCNKQCIERILQFEYGLSPVDSQFDFVINFYLEKQCEFHEAVSLFNAWYALIKRYGIIDKTICLESSFPSDFIILDFTNRIVSTYSLEDIEKEYHLNVALDRERIEAMQTILEENCTANFRGKYEFQFLSLFLQFLNQDAANKHIYIKEKRTIDCNRKHLISHFSQYAETPKCLKEYIIKMAQTASIS